MAENENDRSTDDDGRSESEGEGGSGAAGSLLSSLKSKEILVPAAISAVGALAASAGPGVLRKLTQSTENKGEEEASRLGRSAVEGAKSSLGSGGGLGGLAGKAVSKALGGGGGNGGGGKKTRRLPIQRWTDVAVPVAQAYDAWLKFDQYPQFMHRVLSVEQEGNDRVRWEEKIWFSKRQWEGRITDRRKNDRIAWKTTSGMSHKGVVSFHPLGDNLTRVMVTMDFEPTGMIEKMASGLRFVKRAVQADLARYKAFVEMEDARGLEYRSVTEDEDDDDENASGERAGGSRRRRAQSDGDGSDGDDEQRERGSRRETSGVT
jgi:uncharacterized membrane protein